MALTNPINKQNIVNRFADYVVATANGVISWGTNAKPFGEMPDGEFGGDTSGRAIGISGANIGDTNVTASTIRSVLEGETASYTNIRNLRALLFVTGGGGNTGSRPTPGFVFDQTAKSHLNTDYRQALGAVNNANVVAGQTVSSANLETYFSNLRSAYSTAQSNVATVQIDVCHASCHSSCHGSRGRR